MEEPKSLAGLQQKNKDAEKSTTRIRSRYNYQKISWIQQHRKPDPDATFRNNDLLIKVYIHGVSELNGAPTSECIEIRVRVKNVR